MSQQPLNLLRFLIEIRHQNDEMTVGFILADSLNDIPTIMEQANHFFLLELINGETIYLAKQDVKAFKVVNTQTDVQHHIWSFDPYTVLGVTESMNEQALQKHYIDMLKKVHPDVIDMHLLHPAFKTLATDMTRRIMSAFELVRSDISLKNYTQQEDKS